MALLSVPVLPPRPRPSESYHRPLSVNLNPISDSHDEQQCRLSISFHLELLRLVSNLPIVSSRGLNYPLCLLLNRTWLYLAKPRAIRSLSTSRKVSAQRLVPRQDLQLLLSGLRSLQRVRHAYTLLADLSLNISKLYKRQHLKTCFWPQRQIFPPLCS